MSAFNDYFVDTIKNRYADFDGRARRSEFWYFYLFNILISFGLMGLALLLANISPGLAIIGTVLQIILAIALFVPNLALSARRLHDTNKSGWLLLVAFIPLIGVIILIVLWCMDGDKGQNQYGPDPKTRRGGDRDMDILDSTLVSE